MPKVLFFYVENLTFKLIKEMISMETLVLTKKEIPLWQYDEFKHMERTSIQKQSFMMNDSRMSVILKETSKE